MTDSLHFPCIRFRRRGIIEIVPLLDLLSEDLRALKSEQRAEAIRESEEERRWYNYASQYGPPAMTGDPDPAHYYRRVGRFPSGWYRVEANYTSRLRSEPTDIYKAYVCAEDDRCLVLELSCDAGYRVPKTDVVIEEDDSAVAAPINLVGFRGHSRLQDAELSAELLRPDLYLCRLPEEAPYWDRIAANRIGRSERVEYAKWLASQDDPHSWVFQHPRPFQSGSASIDWFEAVRRVDCGTPTRRKTLWQFARITNRDNSVPFTLADGSPVPQFVAYLLALTQIRLGPDEGLDATHGFWARSTRLLDTLARDDHNYVGQREYRLARCGAARRFEHAFTAEQLATLGEAERIAEGIGIERPRHPPYSSDMATRVVNTLVSDETTRRDYLCDLLLFIGDDNRYPERAIEVEAQEAIIWDIYGGNNRKAGIDDGYLNSTVVAIARSMYASRDFSAMPLLADALLDAGFTDEEVLEHCRANSPHVKGCWVIDEILRFRSFEARLRHWSMFDPLTRVGNRLALHRFLEKSLMDAVASSSSLAILRIDIDRFQEINMRLGHVDGDRFLVALAQIMRAALQQVNSFLCRDSGDGFSVILPGADLSNASRIGERLRQEVAEWREGEADGTISVGVVALAQADSTAEALFDLAHVALLDAKRNGRNRVCVRTPQHT